MQSRVQISQPFVTYLTYTCQHSDVIMSLTNPQYPFICRPRAPSLQALKHWSTVSEKHENQFLCQHFKMLSVRCLTDCKQSLNLIRIATHSCRDPETAAIHFCSPGVVPSQSYGTLPDIRDHRVLPATRHNVIIYFSGSVFLFAVALRDKCSRVYRYVKGYCEKF